MKIIGLTGSIGSGKSTVSGIIRKMGIPVICADHIAKQVVETGQPAYRKIIKNFGQKILNPDKSLNRTLLGQLVFGSATKRKQLNRIVHPYVIKHIRQQLASHKKKKTPLIVLDIPLLYEEKLDSLCNEVIVVYAPAKKMLERVRRRDLLPVKEIKNRIASQVSIEKKKKKADWIIDNSKRVESTKRQVKNLFNSLGVAHNSRIVSVSE